MHDRSRPPRVSDLVDMMGPAKSLWDEFVAEAQRVCPGARAEWKFYAGKTGWRCVMKGGKKNVAYLKPRQGGFMVSLALSEEGVAEAEGAGLPAGLVRSIRESPKLPEGRAARVEVETARQLATAKVLVGIKART